MPRIMLERLCVSLFCTHTLIKCYVTKIFLLASSSDRRVQQSVPLFNKRQVVFDLLSVRGNRGILYFSTQSWPK